MNIVLPPTSGAASCPAPMPVENVQDTPRRPTFCALIFVEAVEPRRRAVLRRHHPLPIVLLKRGRVGRDRADTACAESGREVSRVCPWPARSATPEIPASASARSLASGVSITVSRSKRVSGAASVERLQDQVSARTKVIRRPMVPDSSLTAGRVPACASSLWQPIRRRSCCHRETCSGTADEQKETDRRRRCRRSRRTASQWGRGLPPAVRAWGSHGLRRRCRR